MSELKKGCK